VHGERFQDVLEQDLPAAVYPQVADGVRALASTVR